MTSPPTPSPLTIAVVFVPDIYSAAASAALDAICAPLASSEAGKIVALVDRYEIAQSGATRPVGPLRSHVVAGSTQTGFRIRDPEIPGGLEETWPDDAYLRLLDSSPDIATVGRHIADITAPYDPPKEVRAILRPDAMVIAVPDIPARLEESDLLDGDSQHDIDAAIRIILPQERPSGTALHDLRRRLGPTFDMINAVFPIENDYDGRVTLDPGDPLHILD